MAVSLNSSGSPQAVDFGYPSHLDNLDPLTVCAWIYPTGWGQSSFGRVACKEGASTGWLFFLDNATNTDTMGFLRYRSGTNTDRRAVDSVLSLNEWAHVAATYTTTSGDMFVNGEQVSLQQDTAGSGSHISDASSFLFAGNRTGWNRGFLGKIEGLQVYERVLTAAEINHIYTAHGHDRIHGKLLDAPMNEGIPGGNTGTGDFMKDHTPNRADGAAVAGTQTWEEGITAPRRRV